MESGCFLHRLATDPTCLNSSPSSHLQRHPVLPLPETLGGIFALEWKSFQLSPLLAYESPFLGLLRHLLLFHLMSTFLLKKTPFYVFQ